MTVKGREQFLIAAIFCHLSPVTCGLKLPVATNIVLVNPMNVRKIEDRRKTQEVNHVASSSERNHSNHPDR
jgi:hypothetical protein